MSEQDTREKLEADVRQYANPSGYKNTLGASWEKKMLSFLDRQAAITSAEWCWSNDALEEELTRKESEIAELKAEVEKQRQRANDAERGVLSDEWYVARDRYEDDVAALTAERDGALKKGGKLFDRCLELAAEVYSLREALDACGTGTMYELWRKDHARLEALTAALHDKPGT